MRSFPSATRQRLAASVVGALSLAALAFPLAHAEDDDDLRDQQDAVQGRIEEVSGDLAEASARAARAARRLGAAQTRLVDARADLAAVKDRLLAAREVAAQLARDLDAARARLDDANDALREGRAAVDAQRLAVRDHTLGLLSGSDPTVSAVETFMSGGSLQDVSNQILADELTIGNGADLYDVLLETEADLEQRRTRVKEATTEVADKQAAAEDHLATVRGLYEESQAAAARVRLLVAGARDANRSAVAARQRDRAMLQALREREQRIEQRLRELAARDTSAGYTGSSDGFLTWPADAPVTSPYGYRVHPIYGYYSLHNGTDFGVPCGTPLRAGADGTVIDTTYDSVYGNRLFLAIGNVNGKNLVLIYNHLTSFSVSQGARVERGQTVALSGTTGWSTGCHLHFTVMADGVAVDPMTYL